MPSDDPLANMDHHPCVALREAPGDVDWQSVASHVADYFRALGLRTEPHLASVTGQVIDAVRASPSGGAPDTALARASDVAQAMVDDWLNELLDQFESTHGVRPLRGLLLFEMPAVLRRNPEAFLTRNELSPRLVRALRRAAHSVVPERCPTVMERQVLGEVPEIFNGAYWSRLVNVLRRRLDRWWPRGLH